MKIAVPQSWIKWVLKQGTFYVELAWGLFAIQNAARALVIVDGKPLAPFLHAGWGSSEWATPLWIALMLGYGVFSIVASAIGEWRNNNFLARSAVALFGSLLWTSAATAVLMGEAHWVIFMGYVTVAFVAWLVAVTLIVKHDFLCW